MTELIITEKPSQSQKIAEALSDKVPKKKVINKVAYYEITHNGKKIVVGCAVGHLFNLTERKKSFQYPTFDLIWKPSSEISKSALFSKKYLDVLIKLAKESDEFTVACDYDLEGSLIGFNIIKFVCGKKDANRMKFSTLTKKELIDSYNKKLKHLDFPLIHSGEARHYLDYYYGINLSRALTLAVKSAGAFKLLSSGRVQGPALNLLTERELEIKKFKPEPFWELEAVNGITLNHKKGKFFDKKEVDKIFNRIKDEKQGVINSVTKKEFYQDAPAPFDLTSLQLEAYRVFGITPKEALSITQNLYSNAYVSYPRTSSNQLPESLDYKEILTEIGKQKQYSSFVKTLLSNKQLKPNNGTKTDPAHPAIYATGEIPKKMGERERKIYDLIVKRTLATFAEKAKRETVTIDAEINKEPFVSKGTRTIEKGWHMYYEPYLKLEELELPALKKDDKIKLKKIEKLEKETQPPRRFTEASIIKELEHRNLGTKATRAQIVDALYQRDYVKEKSIEVTDLGIKTIEILKKYSPEIIDEKLTRDFEEEMEQIREEKIKKEDVLDHAVKELTKILLKFKKQEKEIGKELLEAIKETREKAAVIGKCHNCKEGDLRILYSKRFKSYFVACSGYPTCKTTFSLTKGLPKPTEKKCPSCDYPLVKIIRPGVRPFDYCINKTCPKRIEWMKENKKKVEEFKKNINNKE